MRAAFSQVWVNQYNILNTNVPFGGKKQSGIGESRLPRDVAAL
jgi:acyl-CoA reductase-like NAD-dependent aldehyde dehydrogenase